MIQDMVNLWQIGGLNYCCEQGQVGLDGNYVVNVRTRKRDSIPGHGDKIVRDFICVRF